MTNNEKEIDILELLIKFIILIRKRILYLTLFLLLGIGLAGFKYFKDGNSFKHMFIVSSKVLPSEFILEFFNDLEQNIIEKEEVSVFSKLKLTKEEGKKLKSLSCDTIKNSKGKLVRITLLLKDSASIPMMKSKVLAFINERDLTRDMTKSLIIQKKQMLSEINSKIAQLDSLQKILLIMQGSKKLSTVNLSNAEYIEFYEQRLKLENEIKGLSDTNTITEYYSTSDKIPFKLFSTIAKYGFVSLFFGIVFFVCVEIYKLVKRRM